MTYLVSYEKILISHQIQCKSFYYSEKKLVEMLKAMLKFELHLLTLIQLNGTSDKILKTQFLKTRIVVI